MSYFDNKVIIITGPTASGKSNLALLLAQSINGVIINADSSQVYKEAPILSNSPTLEEHTVPHYLYNFIDLNQPFKVTCWLKLITSIIAQTINNKQIPILVGGSCFYIHTLLHGLSDIPQPSSTNTVLAQNTLDTVGLENFKEIIAKFDPVFVEKFQDPYRLLRAYAIYQETGISLSKWYETPKTMSLAYEHLLIKIIPERSIIYNNINSRFKLMVANGAIDEAHSILNSSVRSSNYKKIMGLNELIDYLNNRISLTKAIELASQKTRNYAKRQITWCQNKLKHGIIFNNTNYDSMLNTLFKKYNI